MATNGFHSGLVVKKPGMNVKRARLDNEFKQRGRIIKQYKKLLIEEDIESNRIKASSVADSKFSDESMPQPQDLSKRKRTGSTDADADNNDISADYSRNKDDRDSGDARKRPRKLKSDPFSKAKITGEITIKHRDQIALTRQQEEIQLEKNRKQKHKLGKNMRRRTRNGQPIIKFAIQNLLEKIQKSG